MSEINFLIVIYAELFVIGIVAGTLPTCGLYTVGVAVNFILRDGQQGHAFCEDAVLGRHALVEGQVGGLVRIVDVVAVYVAAFASLVVGSVDPAVGQFGTAALLAVGNTPAAHVVVVLILKG